MVCPCRSHGVCQLWQRTPWLRVHVASIFLCVPIGHAHLLDKWRANMIGHIVHGTCAPTSHSCPIEMGWLDPAWCSQFWRSGNTNAMFQSHLAHTSPLQLSPLMEKCVHLSSWSFSESSNGKAPKLTCLCMECGRWQNKVCKVVNCSELNSSSSGGKPPVLAL